MGDRELNACAHMSFSRRSGRPRTLSVYPLGIPSPPLRVPSLTARSLPARLLTARSLAVRSAALAFLALRLLLRPSYGSVCTSSKRLPPQGIPSPLGIPALAARSPGRSQ